MGGNRTTWGGFHPTGAAQLDGLAESKALSRSLAYEWEVHTPLSLFRLSSLLPLDLTPFLFNTLKSLFTKIPGWGTCSHFSTPIPLF